MIHRFETSAKENQGIDEGMKKLIGEIMDLGGHSATPSQEETDAKDSIIIRRRERKPQVEQSDCRC